MRVSFLAGMVLVPALAAAAEPGTNRVRNGDFSAGRDAQPHDWSPVDGITSVWGEDGHPGRCLRFDTSVLQVDKKRFLAAEQVPPRTPRRARQGESGQYATVGAHEGAWAFSAPVTITPDDRYFVLQADMRGPARSTGLFYPQVFVRGYQRYDAQRDAATSAFFQTPHPDGPAYSEQFGKQQRAAVDGDWLMVYRHSLVCRVEEPGVWRTYRLAIKLPSMPKYRPERLLIKPYAMWPLGVYEFDNIALRAVPRAEYDAVRREGHSADGFMPGSSRRVPGER